MRRRSRTVAVRGHAAARTRIAGGEQLAQHRQGQRGGLLRRTGMTAQRALQRTLDIAVRRVPRQVVEPVHFSQCRQAPADGGRGVAVGQAGEVGADGRRCRWDCDKPVRGAPVGKMRLVGLVGAQRGGSRGLLRQRLGGSQCSRAGLALWAEPRRRRSHPHPPRMRSPAGVIV